MQEDIERRRMMTCFLVGLWLAVSYVVSDILTFNPYAVFATGLAGFIIQDNCRFTVKQGVLFLAVVIVPLIVLKGLELVIGGQSRTSGGP